ncbi:hypothetical protein C2I19_12705 [Chromobacterium alticapitis]|uniref:Uncharacterized protein n=1 Tax=Chromobacterium alticapitis TaxID=2073169 RepID=A0A2S5DF40_9NEIS|nr:hypothetical protein C2I19_12705 [Chromobacterium alticapitis]
MLGIQALAAVFHSASTWFCYWSVGNADKWKAGAGVLSREMQSIGDSIRKIKYLRRKAMIRRVAWPVGEKAL